MSSPENRTSKPHIPSPELLREWAKSTDNTMCWGLDSVAEELERLREEVAVLEGTSRAAHVAMAKAWGRPAVETSASPQMPGPKQPPRIHGEGCRCGDFARRDCPAAKREQS